MDAGVAQGPHEVGVEGVEQGGVEAARFTGVDHPDVEERNVVEVVGGLGPHLPEGYAVLMVDVQAVEDDVLSLVSLFRGDSHGVLRLVQV